MSVPDTTWRVRPAVTRPRRLFHEGLIDHHHLRTARTIGRTEVAARHEVVPMVENQPSLTELNITVESRPVAGA